MARAQGARKPSRRRAPLPGFQAISSVSRKKGLEATTLILRPPGKQQVPGRRQVPTGFTLLCHSSRQLTPGVEEEEGLLLAQGGGGSKTGEEKAGSSGSELEGLQDLTWSPPLVLQPRQDSDSGGATERGWWKYSEDAGLPGWGPCKHAAQLLPDRTFLQALSRAPFPFRQTLNMQQ